MQEDNILSLFDDIEVNNTKRISEADKNFCETIQKDFVQTYQQIAAWRRHLLSFEDPQPNTAVKVTYRAAVYKDTPYEPNKRLGYENIGFSPQYALEACTKQLFKLCERFESEITNHFNSTYGTQFKPHHIIVRTVFGDNIDCKPGWNGEWSKPEFKRECSSLPFPADKAPVPSFEDVIDCIIEDMKGKTFGQIAKDLAYGWLKDNIKYDNITTTKNRVKISGFLWYDSWDNKFTYETKGKLYKLLGCIKQHFDWPFEPENVAGGYDQTYGIDYTVRNSPCESFKGYKNGAIELSFKTQEQAQSFGHLCESVKQKAA